MIYFIIIILGNGNIKTCNFKLLKLRYIILKKGELIEKIFVLACWLIFLVSENLTKDGNRKSEEEGSPRSTCLLAGAYLMDC